MQNQTNWKHNSCQNTWQLQKLWVFCNKRRGKARKRSNKGSKKTKQFQKQPQKILKRWQKTTKEIPVSSNILQRKSSQSCKKSRVVLENADLSTGEEFIEEESTEDLYTSSSSDNSNKSSDENKEIIFIPGVEITIFSSVRHFCRNFFNFIFKNISYNNLRKPGCGKLIFTCPLEHV